MPKSTLPTLELPECWIKKIQDLHRSDWHGQLEEAGTGSWVQSLLQTQAGASATLDAAYTRYARSAQQAAYPDAPDTRSVSAERVRHWAMQRLNEELTHTPSGFALAMSASLSTHNEPPGRDHHGWIALYTTDHRHWCIHFRLRRATETLPNRVDQQLACGLLGIELLWLLSQNQLAPEAVEISLKKVLEIDVWHSSENEELSTHLHLLRSGWSPLIYLHRGIAQRYVEPLRDKQVLVAKGSFNPLTRAHTALLSHAVSAAQDQNRSMDKDPGTKKDLQPVFELALHNADKGSVANHNLQHRLHMLATQDYPVVLTLTPTLLSTKTLFLHAQAQQVDFVCGTDLYERVLLPKYYTDTGGLDKALAELFAQQTQLWVGERPQNTYPTLTEQAPTTDHAYLNQVRLLDLDLPVSASAVRAAITQKDARWPQWVSPAVAKYITAHALYLLHE